MLIWSIALFFYFLFVKFLLTNVPKLHHDVATPGALRLSKQIRRDVIPATSCHIKKPHLSFK